jgi:tetratricopeptide (TPR) repeat protein
MYQEAEEEFRKALEIDPAYDEAFYKLGMVYADRYLIKKTEAKLLAEKGNLAESEKKLKGAGELLMEAEKYWSRTFQLKPDSIDEYKTLLIFYLGEMDFLKAFKYFVELKKRNVSISPSLEKWATVYQTNPDSIDCYQILLEYFLAEGHYLDFAAKYARVLEQKGITLSDETKKKLNLACDIPLSDVPDEIKKQLNLGRDNKQPSGEYSAEGSRILGDVFMSCGKYKEAIEEYKKAINVKPDYAEAYYGLGNAYEDAGMHKEAIEEYKKAINVKPDYAEAYCYSGVVYGKLGLYEDAIESFKQAIKVKPDYADAYCNLGVAYGKSGKHQEAIEPFKQAIKVKPDFAEAHYGLTLAYLRTDNKSSAITHYEILKKLDAKLAKELFKYFD